jgi:environmental stress-induced protein Ves
MTLPAIAQKRSTSICRAFWGERVGVSIVQVIRAADCPPVPWKNGGGTTQEIAVFPPGAGMDDFLWRLSMAMVEQPGPFSAFPGIDRTLAVMAGTLQLTDEDASVTLDSATEPLVFDGGATIDGEPLDGPVRDLNAMVRRGAYAVSMIRLEASALAQSLGTTFVIALQAQQCDGVWLEAFDCVRTRSDVTLQGRALVVDFTAVPAASVANPSASPG